MKQFKLTTKTRKIIDELIDKCETQQFMVHRDFITIELYNDEIKQLCDECTNMVMSMYRFRLLTECDMQYGNELNILHVINDIWMYYMGMYNEREIVLI